MRGMGERSRVPGLPHSVCNRTLESGLGQGILRCLRFAHGCHQQRIRVSTGADTTCRVWLVWVGWLESRRGATARDLHRYSGLAARARRSPHFWKPLRFWLFLRLCAPQEMDTFRAPNASPSSAQPYSPPGEDQQLPATKALLWIVQDSFMQNKRQKRSYVILKGSKIWKGEKDLINFRQKRMKAVVNFQLTETFPVLRVHF